MKSSSPVKEVWQSMVVFLGSVLAVCCLLVSLGGRIAGHLYSDVSAGWPLPRARWAIEIISVIADYWWAIALSAVLIAASTAVLTKSYRVFLGMSIAVWLIGAGIFVALVCPQITFDLP